jgi:hypothetical protein
MLISVSVLYQCPSYYKNTLFISYWWNKLNSNEKEILVVSIRTSKQETDNNYRKDYTDTDTLVMVKLEPGDDLLEQAYTGTVGRPIDVDNRALPAVNIENISLNPNVVISRAIPINQTRTLLSQREIQSCDFSGQTCVNASAHVYSETMGILVRKD